MNLSLGIIIAALFLTFVAGVINGSFATPTKYMVDWKEENVWFFFSFWGMLIFPWLTLMLLSPNQIGFITYIPKEALIIAVVGGLLFGIGQLCFSIAIGLIGIGLSFLINISMGTAGTALVPLLYHKKILFSSYGILQSAGIVIFIVAVTIGVKAGTDREKNKRNISSEAEQTKKEAGTAKKELSAGKVVLGMVLVIIAGVGSACQGLSYTFANPSVSSITLKNGMTPLAASISTWIIVFTAAWVPYCIYFFLLSLKRKSISNIFKSANTKVYLYMFIIMALGFWGSVVFFSRASSLIGGNLAPTIAWPLFMIFIILTSNFWGWVSGEWKNAGTKAVFKIWCSIGLFVSAIIVFSCSAFLHP
ncbi:MAG: hypothetical protein K9M56_00020 [Victivallales bacterium]|nr:hypothetical protein [Victivallales bacterium]